MEFWLKQRAENPLRFKERLSSQEQKIAWQWRTDFLSPGAGCNRREKILAGHLEFISQAEKCGWPPDWSRRDMPKLWQYNLHYFDWLWELEYDAARVAALDWIARHPLERGQVGWEPYPISLRLMNWCAFFCARHAKATKADTAFFKAIWASVGKQTEWLTRHLEYRLLGNHLLENAAALALVGACFAGPEAGHWLEKGLKLLKKQLTEQILTDGLHFERSSMYHSRMLYLLLTLENTGNSEIRELVGVYLPEMVEALAQVCHPDGRIALLNDSAFGIYHEPGELMEYVGRLGIGNEANRQDAKRRQGNHFKNLSQNISATGPRSHRLKAELRTKLGTWALPEAGYYGYRGADGSYIVCDAGAIGPDYIPGHAHADIFNYELSLNGQRVIVDSGVHDYEWSETRRTCRSTRAHNTVEIEGQDQAEMWGAFRVARRGYPHDVIWTPEADGFILSAWHDGYHRLKGKPVHHRTFIYQDGGRLQIKDRVIAGRQVECRSFVHLHPDCQCETVNERMVEIRHPAGTFRVEFAGDGRLTIEEGCYFPEFYKTVVNMVLCFTWVNLNQQEISYKIEPQR